LDEFHKQLPNDKAFGARANVRTIEPAGGRAGGQLLLRPLLFESDLITAKAPGESDQYRFMLSGNDSGLVRCAECGSHSTMAHTAVMRRATIEAMTSITAGCKPKLSLSRVIARVRFGDEDGLEWTHHIITPDDAFDYLPLAELRQLRAMDKPEKASAPQKPEEATAPQVPAGARVPPAHPTANRSLGGGAATPGDGANSKKNIGEHPSAGPAVDAKQQAADKKEGKKNGKKNGEKNGKEVDELDTVRKIADFRALLEKIALFPATAPREFHICTCDCGERRCAGFIIMPHDSCFHCTGKELLKQRMPSRAAQIDKMQLMPPSKYRAFLIRA
jgi:hypothetical protein